MAIEFSIGKDDLTNALHPFFRGTGRGRHVEPDYVDIKAQKGEVEFASADFSSSVKAEVASSGCALLPFSLFKTLFRNPQALAWSSAGRLTIRITEGQLQAGPLTLDHPDVSIRDIKAEITEVLPITASLQEILTMSRRFSEQELRDSGMWDRVKAARDEATQMIEEAAKILGPLNITREALHSFVWDQIVKPPDRLRL
jgi:hypothetical protein